MLLRHFSVGTGWENAVVIGGADSSAIHQSRPGISPPGTSSSYSDMAVSYDQWVPAAELTQSYYPSVNIGPGYDAAYNLPISSEYGAQQRSLFGETSTQTYVRVLRADWLCVLLCTFGSQVRSRVSLCRSAREQIPVLAHSGPCWVPVRARRSPSDPPLIWPSWERPGG